MKDWFCLFVNSLLRIVELLTFLASSLRYINEGKENQGTQFPACPRIPHQSASLSTF